MGGVLSRSYTSGSTVTVSDNDTYLVELGVTQLSGGDLVFTTGVGEQSCSGTSLDVFCDEFRGEEMSGCGASWI